MGPSSLLLGLMTSASAGPCARAEGVEGVEVDVLTYNTWGLPRPIARARRARFPGIDQVAHQDRWEVVGLQEVWWGARPLVGRRDLLLPDGAHDSGLAMLTHWGFTTGPLHVFAHAAGFDAWKSKGVQPTQVDVPEVGRLLVLNTHLQAGRGRLASRARAHQVDELLALVDASNEPVLMVGDFNLYDDLADDRDSVGRLTAAGLIDAAVALDVSEATHLDGSRLDRVYLRHGAHTCLVAESVQAVAGTDGLSDHHPLAFRLRVQRRGDGSADAEH